jgi:hypothetical protein
MMTEISLLLCGFVSFYLGVTIEPDTSYKKRETVLWMAAFIGAVWTGFTTGEGEMFFGGAFYGGVVACTGYYIREKWETRRGKHQDH